MEENPTVMAGNPTTGFRAGLPLPAWLEADFPFQRRLFKNGAQTIHFVDAGAGPTVVLQHGNPTWSYLWRRVIGGLLAGGVRVIAPDLVGFGLSSKPRRIRTHTLTFHAEQIGALLAALDLQDITIVGQDWGGPIIAAVAARHPQRVAGAVFANTSLLVPRGKIRLPAFNRIANVPIASELLFWSLNFPIPVLGSVQGDRHSLGATELSAYHFPLRHLQDRVAPLALARMMPTHLNHPTVAELQPGETWARRFRGPVGLVWGMQDPIFGSRALLDILQNWLFRKANLSLLETQAGHFLQEEVPAELARSILQIVEIVGTRQ